MPVVRQVEGLTFTFPDGWEAEKFDDWAFYRNKFSRQQPGIKAVDLLVKGVDGVAYLIEVKDYRHPDTTKPSKLIEAIVCKVLMTLAAILPAKLNADEKVEKEHAGEILKCSGLKVIAHIELPAKRSLGLGSVADIQQKLKQRLRAIDCHPKVVSMNEMRGLSWTVH